jgi:eukaryotic-like serine/threonine-protein kinase
MVLIILSMLLVIGCQSATPSPSQGQSAQGLPPLADVPFYRANPAANGVHPGPGPTGKPELAWRATVGEMHMVPILVDGLLIVGTNDGRVVALDAQVGDIRWSYQADGPIQPSLASAEGLVYASDTAALHAIDVATGEKRWSTPVEGATGRLNVVDGVAYVGKTGGVVGLDPASGDVLWEWDGPPGTPVNAGPIADGVAYFAARDGRVYAIDLADRQELWRQQTISLDVASGQVLGDTFFVSTNQGESADPAGEIYAIDRASGEVRWRFRAPSGIQMKEGPVKDGVLFANGREDGIYALRDEGDRATVLWHVDTPESHWPIALVEDTLYEVRVDGSVGAYATSDGQLLWETEPEGDWAGGPIVSGGMVFLANDTTGIMAFADPALIAQLPKPTAEASSTAAASGASPSLRPDPFTVVRAIPWQDTKLDVPLGMDAGPDDLLYILDTKPEVTVIDPADGRIVRTWGRQGAGPGEFDVSRVDNNAGNGDIAIAPEGRVYVADGSNHRVQVFSPDGEFLSQFGSFGTEPGQFGAIEEIVIAPDGSVYVRDGYVSKFTAEGKFIWRTHYLFGIAVRPDGMVLGTDEGGHDIQMLDPETGADAGTLSWPIEDYSFSLLEFDPDGSLYAWSYHRGAQVVLDPSGELLAAVWPEVGVRLEKRITWGDKWWPSPVFLPDGRAFTFGKAGLLELRVTLP